MHSLRACAAALQGADSLDALCAIAARLGVRGEAVEVDAASRGALGLPEAVVEARVLAGAGALRALAIVTRRGEPGDGPRAALRRVAARLAQRTPHALWIVLAAERDASGLAIAAWSAEGGAPRIAALIVDRACLADSDAETLRTLVASAPEAGGAASADVATHGRWLDVLGREALTRRFYRALEHAVVTMAASAEGRAGSDARREIALLHASRLLFLSFLEAKGWLDGDRRFLARRFERCMDDGGAFHRRILLPLFFGTLNTPCARRAPAARALGRVPFLNGGLFQRTAVERAHAGLRLTDDAVGALFGDVLGRHRFTAREDSAAWSEAAVDPEMLGRAFESLMSSSARRATGAFYTPPALVERITGEALDHLLRAAGASPDEAAALLSGHAPDPARVPALRACVERVRVIDPACGSGALLVSALERLSALRAVLGDARDIAGVRRAVLAGSIFGVDVNPTAVWLCELRLWLSVSIDLEVTDPRRVPPLPNLDHNVRVGDSLAGGRFDGAAPVVAGVGRALAARRERYVRASGARKRSLGRALDREERGRALARLDARLARISAERREMAAAARARDLFGERPADTAARRATLAALRAESRALGAQRRATAAGGALPFAFATHFPEAAANGGFEVVVANPPWVRPHHATGAPRAELRQAFRAWREAAWAPGALAAGAGRGFSAQVDLAALFVEQSLALARPGGTASLLVPAKLWRALAGGGVRRVVLDEARVLAVADLSEARDAFDAVTYPSLLVARRLERGASRDPEPATAASVHRRGAEHRFRLPAASLAYDETPGSPWLVLPADVRSAFDRIRHAGVPLGAALAARATLGVKCGCNEAFVVRLAEPGMRDGPLVAVRAGTRSGAIERALLRPMVRGETLAPWRTHAAGQADREWLVWTHDAGGAPLDRLPAGASRWLGPWRRRLAARADARGREAWWSLYRTDGARCDRPRVVWADIGRRPLAGVLLPGDPTVALNSCYVAPCVDETSAFALAALLNGPVAAAWLDVIAEPARGGYRRYLAWTMALLPVPADWRRARTLLAPLGERAWRGDAVTPDELEQAALQAYGLARGDIDALCAWTRR